VSTIALSRRQPDAAQGWAPAINAASWAARQIARRLKIRSDRRLLQSMPDYLLADIGISRAEIETATEFGRERR